MTLLDTVIVAAFLWILLLIILLRVGFRALNNASFTVGWTCILLAGTLIALSGPIAIHASANALLCHVTIFEKCALW